ncbi:hypothetical protein ALC62_02558 [Cyphomyrmex costatus]|uniref:Uncharacterized protein n=1 Tax=Cyphomyrmex costatus TaxID=456900 RepID=A0A195D0U0_9HYME|nr:hypothetical protein ALC62_02558 [Cyphomyrmex costatus]
MKYSPANQNYRSWLHNDCIYPLLHQHYYQFHYSCMQRSNYPRAVDNSFRDTARNWHHRDLLDNPSNDLHDQLAYTIPCRNNICLRIRCSCKLQEIISSRINRLIIAKLFNV